MEYQLVKPIIKVGNSAGVILPKNWLNGKAKIELIAESINIQKDIFEILKEELKEVIGIYLYGSYAREEQGRNSDIDVLVITEKENKKIEKGKYNIILISKENLEKALKENILPIIPMIREAKPIINRELLEEYKKKAKLSKKNLKNDLDRIKSALKINKKFIELKKEYSNKISDSIAYSLILNLRSTYIIDCLIQEKKWGIKEFLSLIKEISGGLEAYEGYLRVKNKKKKKEMLQIKEAEKLLDYLIKKIKELEQWIKRKERKK